jgi:hypothetical protein
MCRALLVLFISILAVHISKAAYSVQFGTQLCARSSWGNQWATEPRTSVPNEIYDYLCSLDNCLTTGVSAWLWLRPVTVC